MRAWATVFKFCVFSQARGGSLTLGQRFTKLIPGRFGGRFISGEHIQLDDFPVARVAGVAPACLRTLAAAFVIARCAR